MNKGAYEYRATIGHKYDPNGKICSPPPRVARMKVRGNSQISAAKKIVTLLKPPTDWKLELIEHRRVVEWWRFDRTGKVVVR